MMLPPALATGRRFTTDAVIGESLNTVDENRNNGCANEIMKHGGKSEWQTLNGSLPSSGPSSILGLTPNSTNRRWRPVLIGDAFLFPQRWDSRQWGVHPGRSRKSCESVACSTPGKKGISG